MAKKTNLSSEIISEESPKGAGHANHTGSRLEIFVENALREHNYTEFWNHKEQVFGNRKSVGGKQYAKGVLAGTSIYETKRIVDFLVLNSEKFPDGLIIECRWQQSVGSVDNKFPMLVFNVLKTGVPTIILLDGGGYSKKAEAWLKSQASPTRALIGVWDMKEFQTKVNNGFLG